MANPSLWHYRAYDLHFVCDFELPELAPWTGDVCAAPDVTIVTGAPLSLQEASALAGAGQALQWGARQSSLLFKLARFTLSAGAHILVEPVEDYGPSSWRLPLLGSVMAALLEQRGLFALHAGALDFGGAAAAFLGDKGQGKSTLNAALSCAGFPLFCDDVVALQMPAPQAGGAPIVLPGFWQIKLSPAALPLVTGTRADDWPIVAPELAAQGEGEINKRSFQAPLATGAAPLRALFVLHSAPPNSSDSPASNLNDHAPPDDGVRLRRLGVQEALAQLIPHTFAVRFGPEYLTGERRAQHFRNCAQLVSSCAVWELSRPRDLALLPATVERIARAMEEMAEMKDAANL